MIRIINIAKGLISLIEISPNYIKNVSAEK